MPKSCSGGLSVAFLLASIAVGVASAQNPSPSGNLHGKVRDEQGRALAGALVHLEGPGAPQEAITESRGEFRFLNLSPGAYFATISLTGFSTVKRAAVIVTLGRSSEISIVLTVSPVEEAVTVSAADPRETQSGSNFSRDELDHVPTSRDPWTVLRQTPGVLVDSVDVGGSESAGQAMFVGKGSHFDQNTYNIDGVAVTDMASTGATPLYFDFDSVQEIEIATGGSDPALATPGVALNLVTRRGTNELKGSARFFYTKDSREYGLEAGGPVVRDRLWLWGAAAENEIPLGAVTLPDGEPFEPKPDFRNWAAKANAQFSAANALTLFYLFSNKVVKGSHAGSDRTKETSWDQDGPTPIYKIEDSHVFSANLFASAYFSYLKGGFSLTPQGGLDRQANIDSDYVWHNSYLFYQTKRPQHQVGMTGSAFFNTGSLAQELKFGFGYKRVAASSLYAWPGDRIVADEFNGLAWLTRDGNLKYEMNYYDAFLGDTVSTGRWTVTLGARFDYQQGRNRPSSVQANPTFPDLLPTVRYPGDSGFPTTWREVGPRIGATYALGSPRKSLLRASYSQFANQLGSEVAEINAFPGPQYLYFGWEDANGNHRVERDEVDLNDFQGFLGLDPDDPGSASSVNRIRSDLSPPKTDEFIVGFDRSIGPDLSASIAYTYRRARDLETQVLIGTDIGSYAFGGYATGTATAADGFTLPFREPYYSLTTDPPPIGFELRNRPDYRETYSGLEIQAIKRLAHGWMLRGSFAYNDWRKHVGRAAVLNPNNLVGGTNDDGSAVTEPSFRREWVAINSRWQFNVSGTYELPLRFQLGGNLFGREGFVIPYFIQVLTHDTRGERISLQIGEVDDDRLPAVFELDLHLERTFQIGRRVGLTGSVDCFNVPDRRTVLQRVARVGRYDASRSPAFEPDPAFHAVAEVQRPRLFRLGARVSF